MSGRGKRRDRDGGGHTGAAIRADPAVVHAALGEKLRDRV
ncbi:MAG: hypothetical protein QOI33_3966, partial [Mycobacterium sp.]|nr:hypothetical protein [Mycobacterium sp.]